MRSAAVVTVPLSFIRLQAIWEVLRLAFVDLPWADLSSFVGIASQEAIKLITKQYVPLNNTLIFNGIASQTTTFML